MNDDGQTPAAGTQADLRHLTVGEDDAARAIAYRRDGEGNPTLVWLGGYRSDMNGTKAQHLAGVAARIGAGFCRFDYSGHGASGGRFEDGTISRWTAESEAVIEAATSGPLVLVASSMGAWIALRMIAKARAADRNGRIAGLLLLAPAPDFTHRLMLPRMDEATRARLERDGRLERPSDYGPEPMVYTKALFDDAADNLVMDRTIETGCPVTVIQGMADPDVPYTHALDLVTLLPLDGVTMTLVRSGDHRLSRPEDLALISRAVEDLVERARATA